MISDDHGNISYVENNFSDKGLWSNCRNSVLESSHNFFDLWETFYTKKKTACNYLTLTCRKISL